jgi:hypothetical protein
MEKDTPWEVRHDGIGVWVQNARGERMCDVFPDFNVADPFGIAHRICEAVNQRAAVEQTLAKMKKAKPK